MEVLTFTPIDYFGSNTYLISSGAEAAVIDPSVSVERTLDFFSDGTRVLKYIILTHAHFDHICEIDGWTRKFPHATVVVGAGDKDMLSDSYLNCYKIFTGADKGYYGEYITVSDGDVLQLGGEKLTVMETPGHTTGSISILTRDAIFVGDTVFSEGGVGRCDLPSGNFYLLRESVDKILNLPYDVAVYCGHGPAARLKEIKINFI